MSNEKHKKHQSSKKKGYYERQRIRTELNKHARAARRRRRKVQMPKQSAATP